MQPRRPPDAHPRPRSRTETAVPRRWLFALWLAVLCGYPPPPPGDAGPDAGAGADAGATDGGTERDAGGGDAGPIVCLEVDPTGVFNGDLVINSPTALLALGQVECVTGDVVIELTVIDRLALPSLARIVGSLRIESNALLDQLQLSALKRVGGDLIIVDNQRLADLNGLPLLNRIDGDLLIGGELSFYGNRQLVSLEGLGSIEHIGGDLLIGNNPALTSVAGFGLTELNAGLRIVESPALSSLEGLASLERTGAHLELRALPLLTDLGGLEALTRVGGDLIIGGRESSAGNVALRSVDQLVALVEVQGDLVVAHNPALPQCEANALAQRLSSGGSVGGTFIDSNAPCTDAGP